MEKQIITQDFYEEIIISYVKLVVGRQMSTAVVGFCAEPYRDPLDPNYRHPRAKRGAR